MNYFYISIKSVIELYNVDAGHKHNEFEWELWMSLLEHSRRKEIQRGIPLGLSQM